MNMFHVELHVFVGTRVPTTFSGIRLWNQYGSNIVFIRQKIFNIRLEKMFEDSSEI